MGPIDFDFRPLFGCLLIVGIGIGCGVTLFATSGCMPTINLEWKDATKPANAAEG